MVLDNTIYMTTTIENNNNNNNNNINTKINNYNY